MKLDAILWDQHALVINTRAGFLHHTPDKSYLVNNFADFPDVGLKKSRFRPVVCGVSLQQHLLFNLGAMSLSVGDEPKWKCHSRM